MSKLQEVHAKDYADMPFEEFAQRYHQKFYSDVPFDAFMERAGGGVRGDIQGPPTKKQFITQTISKELDSERSAAEAYIANNPIMGMFAKARPDKMPLSGRFIQGNTFGGADEIMALLSTPIEMAARKTFDPREGYAYGKERMKQMLARSRADDGLAGQAAELTGGLLTGLGLAKAGYTFMPKSANASLKARAAGLAADGALYGATSGFLDNDGLEERAKGAATGGVLGGAIGGAIPPVGAAIGSTIAPITSNISARMNPEAFAQRQVAGAVINSGKSPNSLVQALSDAGNDGQTVYTLADALGIEGRNLLYSAASSPGPGREMATSVLAGRNVDAPRRLQSFLQDASGTTKTAAQLEAELAARRAATATAGYGPVKVDTTTFDPSAAIALANRSISPLADQFAVGQGRVPTDLAARQATEVAESQIRDPIRAAVAEARSYLASPNLTITNVEKAFRAKTNIDQMIADATAKGRGGVVAELQPIADALDQQLAATSKSYAVARDQYAANSRAIEAVGMGSDAAKRGRMEDTIPSFEALNPVEQSAFRGGYFDSLIERLQGVTPGPTNDATRALRSPSLNAEIPAFAVPGMAEKTTARIGREAEMAATNARVLGGSRTAENLNNDASSMVDPAIIMNLLRGNFAQAGQSALSKAGNISNGRTEAVRQNLAEILLKSRGNDIDPLIGKVVSDQIARNALIEQLLRGGAGASAVAPQSTSR